MHRSPTTTLLLCLLVVVALVLALGSAHARPIGIPKPKPCPGEEDHVCAANMAILTICVEAASPAYCGAPVKIKILPQD